MSKSETYDRMQSEIKTAMVNGYALMRDVLRLVVADVQNKTVNAGKELTEDVVIGCLKKFAKQEEDAMATAKAAGRDDIVDKLVAEMAVVKDFLPRTPSEREQRELCEDLYAHSLGDNFGALMKSLPPTCDKKFCAKVFQELIRFSKEGKNNG